MNAKLEKVLTSMRARPVKWIGIAAGAGFGIGLLGRILEDARARHRGVPELLIIDAG